MRRRTSNDRGRPARGGAAAAACVFGVIALCCDSAFGITKQELITEIEARRVAIVDLDVEFVFYVVGANPTNAVTRDARRVVLKGDNKMFIDRDYRIGQTLYETTGSLTGTRGWGYQAVNKLAYTRVGTDIPLIDTEGSGFFDLMAWHPCTVARTGALNPNDLISLLESADSQVLAQTEFINGHECYIVEVLDPADVVVASVSIDAHWGYLPVRRTYYSAVSTLPNIIVHFEIDDAVEVLDDVWLPISGQRITGANETVEELSNGLHYQMSVQSDTSGLRLKVNQGVDDGLFDLSTKLPPKTMVADLDTGQHWIVSARDYAAIADTAFASASDFSRRSSEVYEEANVERPFAGIAWWGLMAGAGLTGAGLVFARQRRTS